MKTKDEKQGVGVKKLYKVDPKRLSVMSCSVMSTENTATTFENFTLDGRRSISEFLEQLSSTPVCLDGYYFFRTEEEAQDFVKRQIGM